MQQSVFTLTPFGHAMETFRLWEALQSGSIPVLQHPPKADPACGHSLAGFMLNAGGIEPPLVFVQDWGELPELMREAGANVAAYQDRQDRMLRWHRALKDKVYGDMWEKMKSLGLERL